MRGVKARFVSFAGRVVHERVVWCAPASGESVHLPGEASPRRAVSVTHVYAPQPADGSLAPIPGAPETHLRVQVREPFVSFGGDTLDEAQWREEQRGEASGKQFLAASRTPKDILERIAWVGHQLLCTGARGRGVSDREIMAEMGYLAQAYTSLTA